MALAGTASNRSIQMSSADTGTTNATYSISFNISSNMKSYIVDFCSESPLPGDNCTAPAGLDLSAATPAGGNTSGWTISTAAAQVKADNAIGMPGGSAVTLVLNGIKNPNSVGTFYGRIYTFNDAGFGTYASPTSPGNYVDFGGIALSTVSSVAVSALVQEEITFCVSATSMGNGCSGETSPTITIGHGTPPIVDGSQVDTGSVYMQTSTNAQSGAQVRLKTDVACGGLSYDNGGTCPIPPAGNTPISFNAGTADFGLNVAPSTGGIGSVTPISPYDQSGAAKYAFDMDPNLGVTSVYGSEIADSGGGCSNVNSMLTFAAAASNTTAAGTYNTALTLIATGSF